MNSQYLSLRDYVESLLKAGKRSDHEDFKKLFAIYGKEKIALLAKEILKQEKEKESREPGQEG